jgi:hypothetical protein
MVLSRFFMVHSTQQQKTQASNLKLTEKDYDNGYSNIIHQKA